MSLSTQEHTKQKWSILWWIGGQPFQSMARALWSQAWPSPLPFLTILGQGLKPFYLWVTLSKRMILEPLRSRCKNVWCIAGWEWIPWVLLTHQPSKILVLLWVLNDSHMPSAKTVVCHVCYGYIIVPPLIGLGLITRDDSRHQLSSQWVIGKYSHSLSFQLWNHGGFR